MYEQSVAVSKLGILFSFNCESLYEKIFKTIYYFNFKAEKGHDKNNSKMSVLY